MRHCLIFLACLAIQNAPERARDCLAQQATDVSEQSQSDEQAVQERLEVLAKEFRLIRLISESEKPTALQIQKQPLLSFTNPVRGRGQIGSIYLWTRDQRPEVIGSLWTFRGQGDENRLSIELHSLSDDAITAQLPALDAARRDLPKWTPPTPGIKWHKVSPPMRPQISLPLLRTKLRRHAAQFTAEVIAPDTGTGQSLRLLSKPLYEYQTDEVVFGAMFAFVLTTDPELILCLEAKRKSGTVELHYALARMTGRQLHVKLDSQELHEFDRAQVWDGTQAYYFCPNASSFE